MSMRYKGGVISATAPTTNKMQATSARNPGGFITGTPVAPTPSAASGVWTLEQQLQAQQAGTWPYGGPFNYIEDVFSTWLYTGTGAAQTITNNINLSGNGGLVWIKSRSAATNNNLFDTTRGATKLLHSNTTDATVTDANSLTAFGTTGFTLGSGNTAGNQVNTSSATYVSWTFREQPKFFDVVTFTSSASGNKTFSHNLDAVPGCVIIKNTQTVDGWAVYHRSVGNDAYLLLNSTAAQDPLVGAFSATSTTFTISTSLMYNSQSYVVYLFAHNAGGFGLTGSDSVISCGSYINNDPFVTLGWEPQWILTRTANRDPADGYPYSGRWIIEDIMRLDTTGSYISQYANSADAEISGGFAPPAATGFQATGGSARGAPTDTVIYIAIRRGPMKVPTIGTSVFSPVIANAAAGTAQTTNFVIDSQWKAKRSSVDTLNTSVDDRQRGTNTNTLAGGRYIITSGIAAEATASVTTRSFNNTGFEIPTYYASTSTVFWSFGRAPNFFDVVRYTGTGAVRTVNHNLGVVPEMMISKTRGTSNPWQVWTSYFSFLSGTAPSDNCTAVLNGSQAFDGYSESSSISALPTASVFSLGTQVVWNGSGNTAIMYLFASCPGVSKVGSYSGTGATQTINCGFTGGARFVLIRRTDSNGDWYVWDTARGMVAGTDPSLLLNTTAAEVNANSVYTTGVGFQIVSTAAGINASGGTYIFLAVA